VSVVAIFDPPNTAAVLLTTVIPICTVARNRSGFARSVWTARAR
jgi:hypothetical protein